MSKILEFSNTSAMQFEIAEDHIKRNDFPSAVQALRRAVELGEKGARIALGEALLHAGLLVQSFETFVEAYASGDRSGPCLFGLCRASFLLGFDEDSADYFKEIFVSNPTFTEGLPEGAIEELGSAISDYRAEESDKGFVFVGKGAQKEFDPKRLEQIRIEPDKALPYFESFTKSSPLYVDARNYVALIYLLEGEPEIAMHECEKIIEENPTNVFAMSTLIACYSALGLKGKEQYIADKIDEQKVTDGELLVKISLAMCQANRHKDAVRYFEKLDDRRFEKNTIVLLAIAYHNSGEREKAKKTIRDAQKLYPKDSAFLMTLTELMIRKKEPLDYTVTLSGGIALALIAEIRTWFDLRQSSKNFDFDALSQIMKSERNYRLLYWYLTSGVKHLEDDDEIILFRLMQARDENSIRLIKEIMIDFSASEEIKCKCLRTFLWGMYKKEIQFLQGGKILLTKPIYPENYEEDILSDEPNAILYTDAFAYAYIKALADSDGFEKNISAEFEKVRQKVLTAKVGSLRSPYALSAVVFGEALIDGGYTEKELCDMFIISPQTYKKYKNFLYEGQNNEECH